jgi:hypothetical protein
MNIPSYTKVVFSKRMIILIAGLCFARVCDNQMNGMAVYFQNQVMEDTNNSSNPKPDYIVIVVLENHEYSQIIGSCDAPYINALARDTFSAIFTRSYIIAHPSQPNYLDFYSGSSQGVIDDTIHHAKSWQAID